MSDCQITTELTPVEAEALANYLKLNEDVEDVLPNYRFFLQAVPNDARYSVDQSNLQSLGPSGSSAQTYRCAQNVPLGPCNNACFCLTGHV